MTAPNHIVMITPAAQRDAPGSDGFVAILQAAKAGTLPPGIAWEDFDLTEAEAVTAFAALILDVEPSADGQERAHFDAAIESEGLAPKVTAGIL